MHGVSPWTIVEILIKCSVKAAESLNFVVDRMGMDKIHDHR